MSSEKNKKAGNDSPQDVKKDTTRVGTDAEIRGAEKKDQKQPPVDVLRDGTR